MALRQRIFFFWVHLIKRSVGPKIENIPNQRAKQAKTIHFALIQTQEMD